MNRRGFLRAAVGGAVAAAAAPTAAIDGLVKVFPVGVFPPAVTGLTLAKLLAARELLDQAEVVGPFTMYCSEKQFNQLLASTETGA